MSTFTWPPIVVTATNPSVGTNGVTAPTSSTEVAGIDGSGNLHALQTDSSGNLKITGTVSEASIGTIGASVPTSATYAGLRDVSGNLAPFIATAAGYLGVQDIAGEASLSNIDTHTSNIDTKTPTVGQKTMAASSPVVIASDQSSLTVSQATGTNLHTVVDSSALPSGAATAANQATEIASLATIATNSGNIPSVGQKTMSGSQPVVIASDQSTVNIADATLDLYVAGPTPATQVINTNLLLAVTGTAATDLQGYRSISFQVNTGASTTAVAVNFEGSDDNVNFIAVGMYDKTTPTAAPVTTFTTAVSTSRYFEGPLYYRYFRVRLVAAITAGTVQAFSLARKVPYMPAMQSLAAGTQIIGALSANQSTNVAQINGVAPLMGNGVTGTGSLRVTLASDTTSNTNALLTNQKGRSLANAPTVTTYGTPITSAAYTTIIASTTSATSLVEIFDSSGVALKFAVGAAASEVDQFVIYPGGNGQVPLAIPAGSRISYKAVSTSASGATAFNVLNLYT